MNSADNAGGNEQRIATVNTNREIEERVLRQLDILKSGGSSFDQRWIAIARTHIEQGFMAMNRGILPPQRIKLPED